MKVKLGYNLRQSARKEQLSERRAHSVGVNEPPSATNTQNKLTSPRVAPCEHVRVPAAEDNHEAYYYLIVTRSQAVSSCTNKQKQTEKGPPARTPFERF